MAHDLDLSSAGTQDTRRIAGCVADHLRPGDVVALTGELGAGKTCFVQGAARALGVTERVTSPSFLLRRDYAGQVGVVHLDVYRLDSLGEVTELGFDDVFDPQRITFIEWGDALRPVLPASYLEVELRRPPEKDAAPPPDAAGAALDAAEASPEEPASGEGWDEQRLLRLRGHGPGWSQRIAALAGALSDRGGEGSASAPASPPASPRTAGGSK